MGTCCWSASGKKNYVIKVKKVRNKKDKKIEEINFEIINTNNNEKKELLIKNNYTLAELLTLADYNVKGELDIQLTNKRNINEELNSNLKDIIEKYYPDTILLTVTILVTCKGLFIPFNIKKAYTDITPIIGNAFFENPKLFILSLYIKDTKLLIRYEFNKEEYPILKKFNSLSTFCSAKGKFFLSGGEKEEEGDEIDFEESESSTFISIDMEYLAENNQDLKINILPTLLVPRSWHSMIVIPNQYIFIVGGQTTKSVEIYDIEKNEIFMDGELVEKRCEATLCIVNNIFC